jgi:hypothetical protein
MEFVDYLVEYAPYRKRNFEIRFEEFFEIIPC